jgi:hypothetical protein
MISHDELHWPGRFTHPIERPHSSRPDITKLNPAVHTFV